MSSVIRRSLAAVLGAGIVLVSTAGVAHADHAMKPAHLPAQTPNKAAPQVLAADAGASPSAYQVKVNGVYQSTNYYCVPASSQVSLGTFGISVSQSTLAGKMHTTPKAGTSGANALPVLNGYENPKGFKVSWGNTDQTSLSNEVRYDVGVLHRATVLGVWMEKLPWNKGLKGHFGHGIVVDGYDATKGTITVWDPWKPTGGAHTLSAKALAAASQTGGLFYVSH